jgi:hypothetical protein
VIVGLQRRIGRGEDGSPASLLLSNLTEGEIVRPDFLPTTLILIWP